MKPRNRLPKILTFLAAVFFTLAYPYLGCRLAGIFEAGFSIRWLYIHHAVQMVLALLSIMIITMFSKPETFSFGLNCNDWRWSLKTAALFGVVWFAVSLFLNLIFDFQSQVNYELTAPNIILDLVFDFAATGFSEEILFRGLIMGVLLFSWSEKIRIGRIHISAAGLLTTFFFSLAHVGIDYQSLTVTSISLLQLLFCGGLGLFYAVLREKTDSLVGPIAAHGASDGLLTVLQLWLL